jgi:hypothetical protein
LTVTPYSYKVASTNGYNGGHGKKPSERRSRALMGEKMKISSRNGASDTITV